MRMWNNGDFTEVKIGQKVLIARCSQGHTYFGEFGKLVKVTAQHSVFVTDSGAVVKTEKDNLHNVVGKAKANNYFVSINVDGRENDKNFIRENVMFWNNKKCCFETK